MKAVLAANLRGNLCGKVEEMCGVERCSGVLDWPRNLFSVRLEVGGRERVVGERCDGLVGG